MKPIVIRTVMVCSSLFLFKACTTGTQKTLPSFKIDNYKAITLPHGGGNIVVEGRGATPGKDVTIQLGRQKGDISLSPHTLGKVKANALGVFSFKTFEKCAFSSQKGAMSHYIAIDTDTGRQSVSPNVDPGFLDCP